MADVDHQQLGTVQSAVGMKPQTIASAATVAPTSFLTRITGTTPITTITPFVTGAHMIALIFTTGATANAVNTGGNIAAAWTSVADRILLLVYDPRTALYYPMTVA